MRGGLTLLLGERRRGYVGYKWLLVYLEGETEITVVVRRRGGGGGGGGGEGEGEEEEEEELGD